MSRKGLTVLEVLIGIILLVLGAIPVLALFGSQEQETGLIAERLLVINHLRRQLDRLESHAVATRFAVPLFTPPITQVHVGGKALGITVDEQRSLEPSQVQRGVFEARVSARWQDPTGRTPGFRQLELARLICDPERGAAHKVWPPAVTP